jgi:hypothetical protein
MITFNPDIVDKFVGRAVSEFTIADLPPLNSEFPNVDSWIVAHFINNVTSQVDGVKIPSFVRQLTINLIRRSQACVNAYSDGREFTLKFLNGSPLRPNISAYYSTLFYWETLFLNLGIWSETYNRLAKQSNLERFFEKNDGSREEKAYGIYCVIKHLTSQDEADLLPIWINNEGFHGGQWTLSFVELAALVRDIANFSQEFIDIHSRRR